MAFLSLYTVGISKCYKSESILFFPESWLLNIAPSHAYKTPSLETSYVFQGLQGSPSR